MNKQRQQLIDSLINETFAALNKLQNEITAEDLQWADGNYETNDIAGSLANLAENLIDSGKQFYLYEN